MKKIDIKPEEYLVCWYDEHDECFDEDRFDNLEEACRWNYHKAEKESDYIKVYALIEIKNKIIFIELFDNRNNKWNKS